MIAKLIAKIRFYFHSIREFFMSENVRVELTFYSEKDKYEQPHSNCATNKREATFTIKSDDASILVSEPLSGVNNIVKRLLDNAPILVSEPAEQIEDQSEYDDLSQEQQADHIQQLSTEIDLCENISIELTYYPKEETFELFGHQISNCMLYTSANKTEAPFAINLDSSPVFDSEPTEKIGYWPEYSKLSQEQQGYYIQWLSKGKPYVNDLGYVYLYYYGLEARALIKEKDQKEILFEVIELVNKFSELHYGHKLIAYLTLSLNTFSQEEKSKLHTFFINNENLFSSWPVYNSILKKIIPPDKFKPHFNGQHFDSQNKYYTLFGRKNEILMYYFNKKINDLPDSEKYQTDTQDYRYYIAMGGHLFTQNLIQCDFISPTKKAKAIYRKAFDLVEKKTPQMIKKFDGSSSPLSEIEILIYLPKQLREKIDYSNIQIDFADKSILPISVIAEKLGFQFGDKTTIRQATLIEDACNIFGYELEPSVKLSQKPYTKDTKVCIYKNPYSDHYSTLSYNTASLFIDAGYKIALEDGELSQMEEAYIETYANNGSNLPPAGQFRLKMRSNLLRCIQEINIADLLRRLNLITDETTLKNISKFLISVAASDNFIKQCELNILKKITKKLGLSEEDLNQSLHELINDTDNVITVEEAKGKPKKGSKIPREEVTEEKRELKLDPNKLSAIMHDTSDVHQTLSEIFTDENEIASHIKRIKDSAEHNVSVTEKKDCLEEMISILIEKTSWTQSELMNLVRKKGLMLSSLLDEINEWAEDRYGDFLIEEDDNLYILNNDVIKFIKK